MFNLTSNIRITKVPKSRIDEVDFENLSFGNIFTDHMLEIRFRSNRWLEPEIKPYADLKLAPSTKVFHYGQAVFEGMKAYKDHKGSVYLFRPIDHFNRLNMSAVRMQIPPLLKEHFFEGLEALLELDNQWIKSGKGNSIYVRPFIIADHTCIQASPADSYRSLIICSPVKSYYSNNSKGMHVLITQKYGRAVDGGVGYVKAAGNYGAQFFPTQKAIEQGFEQLIWTDASTHEYIEESGTMNLFFRINDYLITPPISDRILDGITRKSIITIAKSQGIPVEIRPIKINEIIASHKNGSLKEVFGSGTAVVVCPIDGFRYQGVDYSVKNPTNSFAQKLKQKIMDIQYNIIDDPYGWRYQVL